MTRKPYKRLGYSSIQELKTHPWFENFDWVALRNKTLKAPFIPKIGDNFDRRYCEQKDRPGIETKERYERYYAEGTVSNAFREFYYFADRSLEVKRDFSPVKKPLKKTILHKSNSNGSFKLPSIKRRVPSVKINSRHPKGIEASLVSSKSTNIISTIRKSNKSVSATPKKGKPF